MPPRMSIRVLCCSILALIAVLMLVLAASGGRTAGSTGTLVHTLYGDALLPLLDLKTVSDGYLRATIAVPARVRAGDLSWSEGEAALRHLRDGVKPAWTDYVARAGGQVGAPMIREAEARIAEADRTLDLLADLLAGQDAACLAAILARVVPAAIDPLLLVLDQLTLQQDQTGRALDDAARSGIRDGQIQLGVLLAIALLAIPGAFLVIRRRVLRPLATVTAALSAVAAGNLEPPLPAGGLPREIGALATILARFRETAGALKQRTVELAEARDKAAEATRARSSFLATLSHEIQQPMNGLMAMADQLDHRLTEDQRGLFAAIRRSAATVSALVGDILDFSRIEAGRLEIQRVPFSLVEVVEDTAGRLADRAGARGLDLVVDLDPTLPDRLSGDPVRLRQVLFNLLGNAVDVSEAGSVVLTVSKLDGGFRFSVTDTAAGRSEEQQSRLFRPFVQAGPAGGSGLGLFLCRRLCQMMGGDIGVLPVPGQGSTLWFELPLKVERPEPLAPEVPVPDARVFAVGVPAAAAGPLARLLTAAGIANLTWAGSLAESLPDAGAEPGPPVILLHAGRDDRGALAAGPQPGTSGRVILMASPVLIPALSEAERAGLFAVLPLPLRRQRLWHILAAALGRAGPDARTAAGEMVWMPPPEDQARAAGALVLVAENDAATSTGVARLLTRLGYARRVVADGVEALAELERPGYGLLLTDCHMPGMDGFGLTAAIRAAEASGRARLPIVALTADAEAETGRQCLDAGMDATLVRPIDGQALARTLELLLPQATVLRRRPDAFASLTS